MIRQLRLSRLVRLRALGHLALTTTLALVAVMLISVFVSHGADAQQQGVIGSCPDTNGINVLPNVFCIAAIGWLDTALLNAQRFFTILVGIEFAWTAILWVFQKENLGELVSALVIKTMGIAFFYFILLNNATHDFLPKIMQSFMQLGGVVSGNAYNLNNPTGVFEIGTYISHYIFMNLPYANFYIDGNLSRSIYDDCFLLLCMLCAGIFAIVISFVVFISFLIAAGQLIMTLIEAYIMVGAGAVLLGFTGSRWTMSFGEKWFGYAFAIGVKLFVISLIVGLGVTLFPTNCQPGDASGLCGAINHIGSIKFYHASDTALLGDMVVDYLIVGATAIIFMMLTTKLPGLAASMMNGSPSLTMGSAMSTLGSVAGAVSGGFSAATSTAMGTMESVMGAATGVLDAGMNTASTLMDNAKEAAMMAAGGGMGGGAEAAAGGGGGLGGAIGGGGAAGGGGARGGAAGGGAAGGSLPRLPGIGGGPGAGGSPAASGGEAASSMPGASGASSLMDKNAGMVIAAGFKDAGMAVAGGTKDAALGLAGGGKDFAMAAASPLMSMDEGGNGGSVHIGLKMPD